jgi:hypothetical protein
VSLPADKHADQAQQQQLSGSCLLRSIAALFGAAAREMYCTAAMRPWRVRLHVPLASPASALAVAGGAKVGSGVAVLALSCCRRLLVELKFGLEISL